MIPSALLLPTERPPSVRDIKRALLTFDAVHLCSPDDRELIPPNTFMNVRTGMPPIMSMPVTAVRPLGKIPGYDASFEHVLESCKTAIEQGCLKVRSAPTYHQGITLGAVLVPDGIPDPTLTYRAYRAMAAQSELVASVVQGMETAPALRGLDWDQLAPKGVDDGTAELFISGKRVQSPDPPLTYYPGSASTHEERLLLTRLCLARLGSIAKNLLACELYELSPYTTDVGVAAVIQSLEARLPRTFDELFQGDDQRAVLARLQLLEDVVITEFINLTALDDMTIADVLKLRTRAWGTANEARHTLNKALKSIALDSDSAESFRATARTAIDAYLVQSRALNHELKKLILNASCDIGMRSSKSVGIFVAAELVQKFLVTGSPKAALVFGGLYHLFKFTKDNAIPILDYMREREELRLSSGYSLFRTYESLPRRS